MTRTNSGNKTSTPAMKHDADVMHRAQSKLDGWMNIYTRQGVEGLDKQTGATLNKDYRLLENECRILFRSGFGRKVVEVPTDDMIREWFTIKGDEKGEVNKYLFEELDAKNKFREALLWAKVFGGSVAVLGLDDGSMGDNSLLEPLNEENLKKVSFIKVYDRYRVTWTSADLYDDPSKPKFGTPEFYTITPLEPVPVQQFMIHESRLIRFDGPITDDRTKAENNWWNDSSYQAIFRQLYNLDSVYHAVKGIIDDFIQIIIQFEGLQNMIAAGQDDLVKKRLSIIDMGRSQMNTIMLDGKENYTKEASTVTGLEKLMQEFQQAVSAISTIPMTKLMGRSPAGQNSTGEHDEKNYFASIASGQEISLSHQARRLVYLVMSSKEGPTDGKVLDDWGIVFNPLDTPTEKEEAETRKVDSETAKNYVDMGAVSPVEVRARFEGTEYTRELHVEGDYEYEPGNNPGGGNTNGGKGTGDIPDNNNNDESRYALSGDTSTISGHKHDYIISDKLRGDGITGRNKTKSVGHMHTIINFEVQPGGTDGHTHELEKADE